MKTFIYFSQGEWRTFQAEHLPTSPVSSDFYYHSTYLKALEQYESEIAALKAKSLKVGNVDFMKNNTPLGGFKIHFINGIGCHEWPGTVELQFKRVHPAIDKAVAILKLPA